ncbi:hypothetical protein LTR59_011085 [Friedmanniomyces endolithicus]|nr:hypothetical protein LTR94_007601 [Friedmanniomyces endolithicus]KAK0785361.1 hypothetical protein LTR59_011085 [Friedmanniomyces endolithicus]KAK0797022.1 hypothetical protein LTR75_010031 [Friedmanniomyces endolithicus]KAK0812375.1 hypothetical protein LTR38_003397 [Friedmanniomyces endolithicus]KAK0833317.1 hypothetical protein LTR03_014896 [Friedmanniomyces endolithicus]
MLPNGNFQPVRCDQMLPVLCTQSAPASSPSFANTSATYQVEQVTGSQSLIGYRDFLTFQFRGVRFAQEPERFTYSSVYNDASGTNYALTNAPQCLQPSGGSTDCLFLNIWTTSLPASPAPATSSLKPVMVYIYGGGFTTGSASSPTTDGGNLAARGDVVVIAIAYRLGALGVLTFNDGIHKGNYWISDQISGLQWVQEHAADFGGDPSQVTIFGESAGAQSVQALVASPKARGLFRAAIIQSTYVDTYLPIPQFVAQFTNPIIAEAGCANSSDQVGCLQAYNATALTLLPNPASSTSQTITIDGTYLITSFIDLNATAVNKTTSSVPIMIGVNRDEAGVLNPPPVFTNISASFYNLNPGEHIQSPSDAVIAAALASGAFPLGTGPTNNDILENQVFNATVRFYTDYQLKCLSEFVAYTGVATGALPHVWFYEFNRTYQDPGYNGNGVCQAPVTSTHPYGDPSLEYFKCHAGDLEMNFGNFARDGLPERDEFDIPYAQRLTDYWTSFARNLNPNPSPEYLAARGYWNTLSQNEFAGPWEPVNASAPSMMLLQWNSVMVPFGDVEQCAVIGESLDSLLG